MLYKAYAVTSTGDEFSKEEFQGYQWIGYAEIDSDHPIVYLWYHKDWQQPKSIQDLGNLLHHPLHDLMFKLPKYYRRSNLMNVFMYAEGKYRDEFIAMINDIVSQCFISTATWGLDILERQAGIEPDTNRPIEERRAILQGRYNGVAVASIEYIKQMLLSWGIRQVDVHNVYGEYRVELIIDGTSESILSPVDIQNQIDMVIPVHYQSLIRYMLSWSTLDNYGYTWNDWDNLQLTWGNVME